MKIPAIPGFEQAAFEKYFKNTGWLMLARAGSLGIRILVGIQVSNYLGPTQNGMFNYPMAIVTFFLAVSALGLDGYITREILHQPEKKDLLLGTAFRIRLLAGILILPLLYVAWVFLNPYDQDHTPFRYVFIVGITGLMQSVNVIDSYFQSKVQGKFIMYVQIAGNILSALTKLILIYLGMPLEWFIWALLFDASLLATGYLLIYQFNGNHLLSWKFDAKLAVQLLKNSWPLAFSAILVSLYMKVDQLMIKSYLGIEALGIYSPVVNLSESWYFIPVAIVTSVFPAIIHAKNTDPARYIKRMQNMYDLMVMVSVSIALIMTFGSTLLFQFFYDPVYWQGAPVLSVHVWAGVFVFLGSASGQYLIAEGYTGLSMMRTGVGAVVNILLNMIWIPKYGIMGAAYATLIAYGIATFLIVLIPKTRTQGIMMFKSLFLVSFIQKISGK